MRQPLSSKEPKSSPGPLKVLSIHRPRSWYRADTRAMKVSENTILVAAYHMLKDEVDYRDLGADHFDRRRRERTGAHLVGRLQRLGYNVALETIEGKVA